MKTIKIFALPSHQTKDRTSGVDFARVIQPMQHLNGYTDGEVKFEVEVYDITKATDWLDVAKRVDVIFFNYLHNPWGYAAMGAMARGNNVKLVLDLDDNLWKVKPDNSAYSVFHKGSEALKNFSAICRDVDAITTTSSYLKNAIAHESNSRHDKIRVFPNYIDLDFYSHRSPFKDDGSIRLIHHGSTTHFDDLSTGEFVKGIEKVMKEYPNVTIEFVGAFLPKFRMRWGDRYINSFGAMDIYNWVKDKFPSYMDGADILVCPLEEDAYNRCKSGIKFLETSSAKIPGVYQRMRQYEEVVDPNKTGFLATTADDWYKHIKFLIDNPEERKKMGEEAFGEVESKHQMKDHVKEYAEFFKSLL